MYPLLMQATVKDYIWGGTKLREKYNKISDSEKLAESWELSCHSAGPSVIANGTAKGKTLEQYIKENGKVVLGAKAEGFTNFPIMIKLIDAKDNLSVQVHPDNDYALKNEGEFGKTEMWYVIEAEPGAELLYGVKRKMTAKELADSLENGTIVDFCRHVSVKKGDVFFIPSGTIHAEDCTGILLASCEYFTSYSVDISYACQLTADKTSFHTFTVLDGTVNLQCGDNVLELQAGETVFIPAGMGMYQLSGKAHLIFTTL